MKFCMMYGFLIFFLLIFDHIHTMDKNNKLSPRTSTKVECFSIYNEICKQLDEKKIPKRYDGGYSAKLVQPIVDIIMAKTDIDLTIKIVKIADVFGKDHIINATTRILARNVLKNNPKITQDILMEKKFTELSKTSKITQQYLVKHLTLEKSGVEQEYTITDVINDYFKPKESPNSDILKKIIAYKNFVSLTTGIYTGYLVINLSDLKITSLHNMHQLLQLIEKKISQNNTFKDVPYLLNFSNNFILGTEDPHFPNQFTNNNVINTKIRKVNFNNNEIRTLNPEFYKNLTNLEYFYIAQNPLSESTKKILEKHCKKKKIATNTKRSISPRQQKNERRKSPGKINIVTPRKKTPRNLFNLCSPRSPRAHKTIQSPRNAKTPRNPRNKKK